MLICSTRYDPIVKKKIQTVAQYIKVIEFLDVHVTLALMLWSNSLQSLSSLDKDISSFLKINSNVNIKKIFKYLMNF